MEYRHIRAGTFLARPNRFIAQVELDGAVETVHVKNTGRCRELLRPGVTVWLEGSENPARKTAYDLVAVDKDGLLINMDAQAPNQVFQEWAQSGGFRQDLTLLRPETVFGASRLDFYWESPTATGFVEVKGVTLEENGHARFPDAPTARGAKHLGELVRCREAGHQAAVCFVLQMAGMHAFSPNDATDPDFGAALRRAAAAGVQILAMECAVTPESLRITRPVPVLL